MALKPIFSLFESGCFTQVLLYTVVITHIRVSLVSILKGMVNSANPDQTMYNHSVNKIQLVQSIKIGSSIKTKTYIDALPNKYHTS